MAAPALVEPPSSGSSVARRRLVDQRDALGHGAVHRDRLAARYAQQVPCTDVRERHAADQARRRVDALCAGRQRTGERVRDARGLMAAAHLDMAAEQQQQDEHGDRVVVDLADAAHGVDDAGAVGEQQRERYRDIHAERPAAQVLQSAAQDGSARVGEHGSGYEQTGPAQIVGDPRVDALEGTDPETCRVHHQLHRPDAGEADPLEGGASLLTLRRRRRDTDQRHRSETCLRHAAEDRAQAGASAVPHDGDPAIHDIDVDAADAGQGVERAPDAACAVGAADAFGGEDDMPLATGLAGPVRIEQWSAGERRHGVIG
jgi:hypothetical protein